VTADLGIARNYGEVLGANPTRRLFRVATSLFNHLFLDGTPQDELGKQNSASYQRLTMMAHCLRQLLRLSVADTYRDRRRTLGGNMKAAVLHAYDEKLTAKEFVKYEDVADPKISQPSDVIVRIGGAGVCRTDLHIVEGIWRSKVEVNLPYIMGHENAGWVEEIGKGVQGIKVGDAVICHPLVTSGHCLACRRGDDMHAEESSFPGINANGGYAQFLLTGERTLIKLPKTLAPKDVAPYTDAGLTAYRAAKKASRHLLPGEYAVVVGAGGLGHIGIQVLSALCAAEIIVVDRAEKSLALAKECGAHHVVKADGGEVDAVLALTKGRGAEAVIDFVGEGDAVAKGLAMTRNGGSYYVVGYGGKIEIPTIDMITSEKTIVGNLVGTYAELVELMALADRGLVKLHTREYKLSAANDALHDLHHGRVNGRAVLIP
jgi:NAD+-dependent secondary alcohol dehydrogenase Adh1